MEEDFVFWGGRRGRQRKWFRRGFCGLGDFTLGICERESQDVRKLGSTWTVPLSNRFEVLSDDVEIGAVQVDMNLVEAGRGRVIIDSGSAESVLYKNMLPNEPIVEGEAERRVVKYVAANGGKMENIGEKKVKFKRAGSNAVNSITFQVTDVSKPLASVSRILDKGNAVIFSRSGSYILNEVSGEKIPIVEEKSTFAPAGLKVQDVHGEEPIRPIDEDFEEDGEGEGELKVDEACDLGRRIPVKVANPKLPSAEEVAEHELTHLPYRSWCSHCVKGKTLDHRRSDRKRVLPEVHLDYCFMGAGRDENTKVIIVAKHWDSKSVLASVVPEKGASNDSAARRICAFLRELSLEHTDLVLRGDQKPAIVDLLNEVSRKRAPAKSFLEQSPVGESQSNGMIERECLTVEGQISVLKDAFFETRIRNKITADHPVLSWLVEFAAVLVNKYEVGHDGKTSSWEAVPAVRA